MLFQKEWRRVTYFNIYKMEEENMQLDLSEHYTETPIVNETKKKKSSAVKQQKQVDPE